MVIDTSTALASRFAEPEDETLAAIQAARARLMSALSVLAAEKTEALRAPAFFPAARMDSPPSHIPARMAADG
jgi:uncharacterized protein with PIN domain